MSVSYWFKRVSNSKKCIVFSYAVSEDRTNEILLGEEVSSRMVVSIGSTINNKITGNKV